MLWFVASEYPWFVRGGLYTNGSGVGAFAFSNTYGRVNSSVSFRDIILYLKKSKNFLKN